MREVAIPSVGFAMTEALLLRWTKQPGESVSEGEAIAEVETDKTTAELEAPASGTVGRHRFAAGEIVPVGVVLTVILEPGETEMDGTSSGTDAESGAPLAARSQPVGTETTVAAAPPVTRVAEARGPAPASATAPPRRETPRQRAAKVASTTATDGPDGRRESITPARAGTREPTPELAQRWMNDMLRIREFESRCDPLVLSGRIAGGVHLSLGQEAVAAGVASAIRPGDFVSGTHRSHHHALAMGIPAPTLMAELFGRATGSNQGRGGSMHVADLATGFIGGNGIVGAGVGISMGAALSAHVRESDQVAVGFVGDGGINTGRTWESVNLAAVWKLPLIVVCENNLYAVETPSADVTASASIAERAAGFGIRSESIDGQDVIAVYDAVARAAELARAGKGPTFLEARTYRYEGHSTGQAITYRTTEEVDAWRIDRDPITRLRGRMRDLGWLDDDAYEALAAEIRSEVDEAVAYAEAAPWPVAADAERGVTVGGASVRRLG